MSCKYWLTWFLTSHLDSLWIHKDHPNTQKKESGRELKSPSNLNVYCYISVNRIILCPFLPSLISVDASQSSLCLRECWGQSWSLCCNQSAGKEILFPWIVTLSSQCAIQERSMWLPQPTPHTFCIMSGFGHLPGAPLLYHLGTELVTTWIGHYLKTHKFKAVRFCWYVCLFGKCLSVKDRSPLSYWLMTTFTLCLHSWGSHQKTGWKTDAVEKDKKLSVKLSGLSASTFHV